MIARSGGVGESLIDASAVYEVVEALAVLQDHRALAVALRNLPLEGHVQLLWQIHRPLDFPVGAERRLAGPFHLLQGVDVAGDADRCHGSPPHPSLGYTVRPPTTVRTTLMFLIFSG